MDCCVCHDMASDEDEPAAIPPSPSHTMQQLTLSSCIKNAAQLIYPTCSLQNSKKGTAKNRHTLQVRLWCKSQNCTKASAIHFANLQEQERWSLRTRKSKQGKSLAHKCNRKEVCDLQEQSHCNIHCKMQEQWDVSTVIGCHGWSKIKVGDEWARRNKAA